MANPVQSPQRLAKNPAWSELPFPARDLIDLEPYREAWTESSRIFLNEHGVQPRMSLSLQLVRKADLRQQISFAPAAAVAEEMQLLKVRAGVAAYLVR